LLARDGDERAERERERAADTAIFYSISNCQDGLRGVSFGNFLIKQVVEELKAELPHLVRFSTLSPVPGFRRWLEERLAADDAATVLRQDEMGAVRLAAGEATQELDPASLLHTVVCTELWWENAALADALCTPLTRICAAYLTHRPKAGDRPTRWRAST
jgi:malonyl-CoA decarboxylase